MVSSSNNHQHENANNNIDMSNDNVQQQEQRQDFRKVYEATAKQMKGRSIVHILYDRSIRGPKGVGGVRKSHYYNQYYPYINNRMDHGNEKGAGVLTLGRARSLLSNTSPSSVIRSGNSDEDRENNNNDDEIMDEAMDEPSIGNSNNNDSHHRRRRNEIRSNNSVNDDMDSLSEVLGDAPSDGRHEHGRNRSDSLSEVLNNHSNNIDNDNGSSDNSNGNSTSNHTNNATISTSTSAMAVATKIPPRLKMNSYPCSHMNEIKNYAESYTVTKFDWSYLSLHSREKIANIRSHATRNRNNSNHNNNDYNNTRNDTRNSNNENIINDTAISTISISFSPDGKTIASTHGDHTVKITCCNTGALIRNLEGHPRTPWTVKYHPTKSNIVASGCLGFQVRIWDWNYRPNRGLGGRNGNSNNNGEGESDNEFDYHLGKGVCLKHIRLQSSIISLSFHPTGSLLAIASGHSLHLWVYDDNARTQLSRSTRRGNDSRRVEIGQRNDDDNNTDNNAGNGLSSGSDNNHGETNSSNNTNQTSSNNNNNNSNNNNAAPSTIITQIRYEHNLRCVYFPPGGDTIILGGVNPPQFPGDTSYSLRLWDFDLEVALNPQLYLGAEGQLISTDDNGERQSRDALKNFKTFLPRALLYGDGGFDVSPDGTKLCGCAEYWLPDGVESAMDLIERKEELAWMEEENARISAESASFLDLNSHSSSPTGNRPSVRSPRRKIKRQQKGKEEKRRKETTNTTVKAESSAENECANQPEEDSGPRTTEGCRTPPNPIRPQVLTSPPLPPGRRWSLQFNRPSYLNRPSQGPTRPSSSNRPSNSMSMPLSSGMQNSSRLYPERQDNLDGPPPPPLPPSRNPNHHSGIRTGGPFGAETSGRFVPHVVVVNLDKSANLGKLLEAAPLGSRATSVTCVKFSPSTEFCLLGYGVREHAPQQHAQQFHPVTALYNVRGGISHVATMLSSDDDVNIAMFHPHYGQGFVYGTKQGRVKVVSPRPWNQYYE